MKKLLLLPAVLLTLTAAKCEHREPGIEVRTVEVPTPVPCLAKDKIPAEPGPIGAQLTGSPAADLPIVTARALDLLAWGRTMHGALTACAD